ncbi:MAG: ATP-binding protein [Candidatus Omnitrophica bacterium]|nr:ATP-binding protein [Candidatus Omnitrophota bacterium]
MPDSVCVGRTEVLDRIMRRALGLAAGYRQNLALIGPLAIGKSTILQHAVALLKQHPPLLPVLLQVRDGSTLGEFAEQFSSTLLHRYWTDHRPAGAGPELPHTFEALVRACQPYVPKTTALLAHGVAKARRGHTAALAALFEAPGQLRQESGRLCVILLDEFHRLSAWGAAKPYAALSRQVMVQQETMYILASSSVAEARRILQERLAVLFGQFEIMPIEPFDLATGVRFLAEPAGLAELGMPILMTLADLGEGYPAVLDHVARAIRAVEPAGPADRPAEDRVAAALTNVLFHPTGALAQQCQAAIACLPAARRAAALPVLCAIAQGQHRLSGIAADTGRAAADVTRTVRLLVEHELVTRRGMFCCVRSRLLRLWLQSAYRIQQGPVHWEPAVAEQAFADTMRQWLQRATSRAPQAVLETAATMMRRFQNELIEIRGRRLRLPKLDVHTVLIPGAPRAVVGQHEEARWLCLPYPTMVREADAVALIQALRHAATPWTRRWVIAIEGLEVNARLLLQEHRFWVWELDDFNQALDLYGVPRLLPTALQSLASVAAVPLPEAALPSAAGADAQQVGA